jgi:hypothetical protein
MTRKQALNAIQFAGYHEDRATGTRLYVENRVSITAYNEAFNKGRRAKAAGVPCNCMECKEVIPTCAASMGCLCVGHAAGNDADAACDTNEERYR